ncbi:MAG: PPK2 family polyphosphate kinase [Thermodesulfobacteriota bacterium]
MFSAKKSPYLVPFNSHFKHSDFSAQPPDDVLKKKKLKKQLEVCIEQIAQLQRIFYAHDQYALLLVFQAMDAGGKDSTIRAVMSGINPAGCQIFSFKQPSKEALDHDFLWRSSKRLPERGRIGIFNRSYYEEVLVVRVHPALLEYQKLPGVTDFNTIWDERYQSICDHEKHLARNGTIIVKFWLNVSPEEQRQRFLSRLNEPEKYWKFSSADIKERNLFPKYMEAYEKALKETSKPWAPWYAIPADNKPYMRLTVARIIKDTLESLQLKYPDVKMKEKAQFDKMRKILMEE